MNEKPEFDFRILDETELRDEIEEDKAEICPLDVKNEILLLLATFTHVCHKLNISYIAAGGTLLSIQRNKRIPYHHNENLIMLEQDICNFLNSRFFKVFEEYDFTFDPVKLIIYKKTDKLIHICISVYQGYMTQDNSSIGIICFKDEVANKVFERRFMLGSQTFPLKLYDYEGMKLLGPKNPVDYLNRVYPNWKSTNIYYKSSIEKFKDKLISLPQINEEEANDVDETCA